MDNKIRKILESRPVEASAPCRIDMGGTLDIATFYYPLRYLSPVTFNMAIGLRTRVRLVPYRKGFIKVSSRGFENAQFPADRAPFEHPLGLMFATAAYFQAEGVHVHIDSSSPPRGALGGSSAAAVALAAAFSSLMGVKGKGIRMSSRALALLVHQIEQSVAGVPCGLQDQLAAAYGGVNLWHWQAEPGKTIFKKEAAVRKKGFKALERHLLLAYCGKPHVSKDINGRWVRQFLAGRYRKQWENIISFTRQFASALGRSDYRLAADCMNQETDIRTQMTPDVLDGMGKKLVRLAVKNHCGARFTGAGGGGCIWALGDVENIDRLRPLWEKALSARRQACLLDAAIDSRGVEVAPGDKG
jgi:D-glycero-alpha-D-manno-heptose-7-phosphate kinase